MAQVKELQNITPVSNAKVLENVAIYALHVKALEKPKRETMTSIYHEHLYYLTITTAKKYTRRYIVWLLFTSGMENFDTFYGD